MTKHLHALALAATAACVASLAGSSQAQVTQPDGVTVVPINQALSKDYYPSMWDPDINATTLGLQSAFDSWEGPGAIDTVLDAATQPATFSPLCGLQGELMLRGGSCKVDFGWYCVDNPAEIYELVTQVDIANYYTTHVASGAYTQYQNNDAGFVPAVGMPPLQGAALSDIRAEPGFSDAACPSKRIGFAFRGNPTDFCPQSKYSEQYLNEACSLPACAGQSWIAALIYPSKTIPGAFYVAFEDLPTRPETFSPLLTSLKTYYPAMKQPVGWDGSNDGDFNDFVFRVKGIQCDGGGQPCTALDPASGLPAQGDCSFGVTACNDGTGAAACTPVLSATPEVCDARDNDCDGQVDNGEGLCEGSQVCFEGQCVSDCSGGEFPCPLGYECDTTADSATSGKCVDSGCQGVECPAGSVCRGGECVGGCEGVVCPQGEECILGQCIDPCADKACPENFVCSKGVCVSACQCTGCAAGFTCETSGLCVDSACVGVVCEGGLVCQAGTCVDACTGVTCPGGYICSAGACIADPDGPTPGGGDTGGTDIVIPGGTGGSGTGTGGGTGAGTGSGLDGSSGPPEADGCTVASGRSSSGSLVWLAGLGVLALGALRRRRAA